MATPADDHSEQSFFFPEFVKAMAPLDSRTALEYFTFSPWYRTEPPSNNQILRMQNTGVDVVQIDEVEELRKFTGIEFAVVHDQAPSFFVIQKRERISPNEVRPMEAYYIINNRIQQSPDLYSLLCNRLNASLHNLTSSMSTLRMHRPTYTPTKGHVWPVTFDPTSAFMSSKKSSSAIADDAPMDLETPAGGGTPATMRGGSVQPPNRSTTRSDDMPAQVQFTIPLLHAIRTTAAHMNVISPYPPVVPPTTQASGKRVIRNAMEIALDSHTVSGSSSSVNELPNGAPGPSRQKSDPSDGMNLSIDTHVPHTTARQISTPGTQVSTPTSLDAGTPAAEKGAMKKKKKRATGLAAAQSPTAP